MAVKRTSDRVALVTGASKGIGLAIARGLARDGCRVCMVARSVEPLEAAAETLQAETGAEVWTVPADVADPEVPQRIVAMVEQRWNGVDVLVNNAGGPPPGSFADHDDAVWLHAWNQTFMSVVRFTRAATPHMRAQGWGRVITVSSTLAAEPSPQMVLSGSARAAVSAFSKAVASELAPFGVTVNVVCPGGVRTDRLEQLVRAAAEKEGKPFEEALARSVAQIPAGRFASPDEFASVAVFLASDAASYVTGTSLMVDGGLTRGVF